MIRYYGWYSNKSRGMRRKAAEASAQRQADNGTVPLLTLPLVPLACPNPTWAMLIKRVYEVDPLACPQCGAAMKVLSFIEPPQGAVIERILRHCGLWRASSPRAPPGDDGFCSDEADDAWASAERTSEVTFVDKDTFWATF